ncbi:efflux pump DEP3 [Colletotrichum spaethianum]|uniref:Efflux pump DEP3 n=1 Tax=Colletotrichum spaethianum TaxID=700344 RepID=A0AA37LDE4_9PEZI|nr:efflux pump DEP3 [Colletotrichum spaethianum]GKT44474.1 efflux pump DEP3 [Colletotrichum spaethianum]
MMETDTKATSGSDVEHGSSGTGSVLPETKEVRKSTDQKRHPREDWSSWRWPCVQVAFILGGMLLGYDVSNIANIQPPIYEAFGNVHLLPWVATGYTASQVCLVPLVRKLAVLGSVKWQIVVYTTIFMVGAAVSGSATGINSVIIGRVVAGIGGAGIYQLVLLVNVFVSTPAELPRLQGLMAVSWAIGLTLGPVIGGAFAENQNATWRWAMYLNLPILAVIGVLIFVALPPFMWHPMCL